MESNKKGCANTPKNGNGIIDWRDLIDIQDTKNRFNHPIIDGKKAGTSNGDISFFKAPITNVTPLKTMSLKDIHTLIIGDNYWALTEKYQAISDEKEKRIFKATKFDYATFSGVFNRRNDKSLKMHSSLITIDFDHVVNLQELKNVLLGDRHIETELLFISPSGNGIKWVVKIDLKEYSHEQNFKAISNYLQVKYNIEVDQSGKDISRACFIPHDKTAYLNPRYSVTDSAIEKRPHQNIFNIKKWLNILPLKTIEVENMIAATRGKSALSDNSIEGVIIAIEKSGIDLTRNYSKWLNIGFALSSEYGENGRNFYHRVSRFHTKYDYKECDNQYTKCINSRGQGIKIATFYKYAIEAGVILEKDTETHPIKKPSKINHAMPTIPVSVYDGLPDFLKKVVAPANTPEEKDILLLGGLTVLSACFPNLFGIYDQSKVHCNLYLFVTAAASSGKGKLNHLRALVNPIHKLMREESKELIKKYKSDLAKQKASNGKGEKPTKPPVKMLFIPANNSATGAYQLLSDNNGKGLIFETEGDTLAQAFKTDYGNYSDGFRKAFHHETISYYRRGDQEYVDIDSPQLSVLLSGTPNQVSALIPSAENGLLSRFMFYSINIKAPWKNVFENSGKGGLDNYYKELGGEFLKLYQALINDSAIEVCLTSNQQDKFHQFFKALQGKYHILQSEEYIATVRRFGIIAFRIMMLFSALRIMEDGDVSSKKKCEDADFEGALKCIEILIKHSSKIFNNLPIGQKIKKRLNNKELFLENLPAKFNRLDYQHLADELSINRKTAEGYITQFVKVVLIHRNSHNSYENIIKT